MDFPRGILAKEFSEKVKSLEDRFHAGEDYQKLQIELEYLSKDFVAKCYRFKIGDIISYNNYTRIEPVDYSKDYCFNNVQFDLIIDYAYHGYDKGLNRLELLQIIEDSKLFHHILQGNYIFRCNYKTYCPVLSGGSCGHALTGCSNTAVAQVMYYWKYPTKYNWNGMSLTYGNDAVAKLMGDIFPGVIDSYNIGGSSCTNDYNIRHTFLNFGYKSASLAGYVNGITENGGYNYETVETNLKNKWPVILGAYSDYKNILGLISFPSGSGHTWVCDGYISSDIVHKHLL